MYGSFNTYRLKATFSNNYSLIVAYNILCARYFHGAFSYFISLIALIDCILLRQKLAATFSKEKEKRNTNTSERFNLFACFALSFKQLSRLYNEPKYYQP